jgi:hypothetical protein
MVAGEAQGDVNERLHPSQCTPRWPFKPGRMTRFFHASVEGIAIGEAILSAPVNPSDFERFFSIPLQG